MNAKADFNYADATQIIIPDKKNASKAIEPTLLIPNGKNKGNNFVEPTLIIQSDSNKAKEARDISHSSDIDKLIDSDDGISPKFGKAAAKAKPKQKP